MGLFDFIKKKEIAEIQSLKSTINVLSKYANIVDKDKFIQELDKNITELNEEYVDLQTKYSSSKDIYNELKDRIILLEKKLDIYDYGVYEHYFDFDTSEQFIKAIEEIREQQKAMIVSGKAVDNFVDVSVNGNRDGGVKIINAESKLALRAFNGECDVRITTVKWNNIKWAEKEIQSLRSSINYITQFVSISFDYMDLKITELKLTHEYQMKLKAEKDEERIAKQQLREEQKVIREIEAARIKAEKEEVHYQKALSKARAEIGSTTGVDYIKLNLKIEELEKRLQEASMNKERAMSMAQQTKSGHVYVISNTGSFGENVYKIGMTRRLDPMDRIRELGDASVPFSFDVHAMIFSDNAPELERKLHKIFEQRRVNMINLRKEFFKVPLGDIEKIVHETHCNVEFVKNIDACEFIETTILNKQPDADAQDVSEVIFPDSI